MVIDVAIVIGDQDPLPDESAKEKADLIYLIKNQHFVSDDKNIWVGNSDRIPELTDILNECEPSTKWQGKSGHQVNRMYTPHYVVVNENVEQPESNNWDVGNKSTLTSLIFLSQLIHNSAIGFVHVARLRKSERTGWDIFPLTLPRPVYNVGGCRLHLTSWEWEETYQLKTELDLLYSRLPNERTRRIRNAIWYRSKIATEFYIELRWTMLITAFEALTGFWSLRGVGRQFPGRGDQLKNSIARLSKECNFDLTEEDIAAAWELRSTIVHGQPLPNSNPGVLSRVEFDRNYLGFERLLDRSLRTIIMDSGLQSIFTTDSQLACWLGY